jgi:AcrR family transcriptional regulator
MDLAEQMGIDAVSMESLASHLGIGKTTLYRRWPNISALLMDAILLAVNEAAPIEELPTIRESVSVAMKRLVNMYTSPRGDLLRAILGRAQTDASLIKAIGDRWVEPRRKIARGILRQAARRGEIKPGLNPDIILDALYGPIYHRLLLPYKDASLNELFVDRVVEIVFDGMVPVK